MNENMMENPNELTIDHAEQIETVSADDMKNRAEKAKQERMERDRKNAEEALKAVEQQAKRFNTGKLTLMEPIRAHDKDITELYYDFNQLTGSEVMDAMDSDPNGKNLFNMTGKQALALFAAAVEKVTGDVDARDIRSRLSGADSITAVQLSQVFFQTSNRAGNRRISNV